MAEKIHYTRRDLKGPDEFISTFGRVVSWCKENRSKVTTAALVVLAAVALSLGTRAYFLWQEGKAAGEIWPHLDQARETLAMPSGIDPARLEPIEKSISDGVRKYPNARAAVYAQYYLGVIAFHRGDYDGSVSRFREGIRIGKDEGIMKYLLRKGIAGSLEAKGDYAGAAASYREAAEFGGAQMKVQAQFSEARVLALSGKKTEAVTLYRQIVKENPESRVRDVIDFKLVQME